MSQPSVIERLENHQIKLTVTIDPARFEEGMQAAYLKNRGKIRIQGFRPGKAPRKLIEMTYGKDFLYEDAINHVFPDIYEAALEEHGLDVVSRPDIDIENVDENGAVLTVEVYVRPEYEIDSYSGIEYSPIPVIVEEEEITAEIERDREKNSRMTTIDNRPVQSGDIAVIDFEGFIDNVPFDGGKGENFELTIGSNSFIDTFEDQIIGHSIDDEFDVNVRFPDTYHAEHLAGVPAMFRVKVNGIKFKELPNADDDFAQEVSDFDTLGEYKDDIRARLAKRKQDHADADAENQILEALAQRIEMNIPEGMIQTETNRLMNEFANRLQSQGINFSQYLAMTGMDVERLSETYSIQAKTNVASRLALEAVERKEGITVSDEEYQAELTRIADIYKIEKDKVAETIGEHEQKMIRSDLAAKKAYDMVKAVAIAKPNAE